jgi:alpha-glucosidase
LLVSLRGNLFLYQGEELGLPQAEVGFADLRDPEAIANWPLTLGRDGARTPMPWKQRAPYAGFSTVRPWLPVPDSHAALAVDAQDLDESSTLSLTRQLVRFRNEQPALRFGSIRIIEASTALLIFERAFEGERLLCAFNLSAATAHFQSPSGGAWRAVHAVGGARLGYLPPLSGLIAASS